MELKGYLWIVGRRWWLAAIAFVITTAATLALVMPLPPIYESSGTMLLRPRALGIDDQAVEATDLLIRGVKIAATYATIARSEMVLDRARNQLGPDVDTSDVTVAAEVLTDTNIMSVTAQGPDPEVAQAMAEAVSSQTIAYVNGLHDAYILSMLDAPDISRTPVGPNKALTIGLGSLFGLLLGISLALFAHYLVGTPSPRADVTDHVTDAYNERFLERRLREEMSRADRTDRSFSVIVMTVALRSDEDGAPALVPNARDLRRVAVVLDLTTRDEAVIAHLGGGEFAGLLPDVTGDETAQTALGWKAGVSSIFLGGSRRGMSRLLLSIESCEYRDQRFTGHQDATRVVERILAITTAAEGNGRQGGPAAARWARIRARAPHAEARVRPSAPVNGQGASDALEATDGDGARPPTGSPTRRRGTRAGTRRK